jgi:GT2 family glycosyltransferase
MNHLEKIDLIITTKNRVEDLMYTINFNLNNIGFKQPQIFIIDDASTDNTYETVKENFPEISIIRNTESAGLIKNRNVLMSSTKNDFIFSLDDDSNVLSKEDIIEAIILLESDTKFGCLCFNPFEQKTPPPPKSSLGNELIFVKSFIGCGHIIKRLVYNQVGNYLEPLEFYCEEVDFSIRAFKLGYKTILKKNLVVHHRIDWEERNKQMESDLSKGVYGAVWRSSLGFSNHLLMDYLHFPFLLGQYLIIKHTLLRFYLFYIKKNDKKGFIEGIRRFNELKKSNTFVRNPLSWDKAKEYLKLKNF